MVAVHHLIDQGFEFRINGLRISCYGVVKLGKHFDWLLSFIFGTSGMPTLIDLPSGSTRLELYPYTPYGNP